MIEITHRLRPSGTELERAQAETTRGKLLKIPGSIRVTTHRVRISFSPAYHCQSLFREVARRLVAAERLRPAPVSTRLPAPAYMERLLPPGHGQLRCGASTPAQRERSQHLVPLANIDSTVSPLPKRATIVPSGLRTAPNHPLINRGDRSWPEPLTNHLLQHLLNRAAGLSTTSPRSLVHEAALLSGDSASSSGESYRATLTSGHIQVSD